MGSDPVSLGSWSKDYPKLLEQPKLPRRKPRPAAPRFLHSPPPLPVLTQERQPWPLATEHRSRSLVPVSKHHREPVGPTRWRKVLGQ